MSIVLPAGARSTLEEGRQAYVAVASERGPHVTPELYAWSRDRLWFAAATSTVKANVLGRRAAASAVVSVAGRSVVLGGPVESFDARALNTWLRTTYRWPVLTEAVARYAVRNAPDLLAFARDAAFGRLGWRPPPLRVVFALEPSFGAYLENDAVVETFGGWHATGELPEIAVPAGGDPAVVALPGPVALPGRWFADQDVAHVPPGLLDLIRVGTTAFPMSVVVDDYTAPGPAAKQGRLVRGRGRVVADDPGFLEIEPETEVDWEGTTTEPVPVP
jgi:hypothetical protein